MISRNLAKRPAPRSAALPAVAIEPLEDRRLLSASLFGGFGRTANTIEFSQAPAAVQSGLTSLASTDQLAAPTATQTVFLRNVNGVETYSIDITGTGTRSVLTVNQSGSPVTAPTRTTTTFGTLSGTGTGSNAAAREITTIATALGLATPASDATVRVSTTSTGVSTYTIRLTPATTTTTTTTTTPTTTTGHHHQRGVTISVDSNGNPVGNESIPFSAVPTTIQTALNNKRPAGATALDAASTQNVRVRTLNGVTTYSLTFSGTGAQTTVTVNAAGTLTSLPSRSSTTYTALAGATATAAAAGELQTLATDAGATGTIDGATTVDVYDEGNGTTIYSVTVGVSQTSSSGNTFTRDVTVSVDQSGNPTTLPAGNGGGFGRHGGFLGFGFDGSSLSGIGRFFRGLFRF